MTAAQKLPPTPYLVEPWAEMIQEVQAEARAEQAPLIEALRDGLDDAGRAFRALMGSPAQDVVDRCSDELRSIDALLADTAKASEGPGVTVEVVHRCRQCIPSSVLPSAWDLEQHVKRFHPERADHA
jgi:hypothetical protein